MDVKGWVAVAPANRDKALRATIVREVTSSVPGSIRGVRDLPLKILARRPLRQHLDDMRKALKGRAHRTDRANTVRLHNADLEFPS